MNGLAMVEVALDEVTRHRLRSLLGMLSIAVGIAAISIIVALGSIAQATAESIIERQAGKPATLVVTSETAAASEFASRVEPRLAERLVRYAQHDWSRLYTWPVTVSSGSLSRPEALTGVDPAFTRIRPLEVVTGRWLVPSDADLFAPVVVVNLNWQSEFGSAGVVGSRLRLETPSGSISARIVGSVDDATKESRLYAPVEPLLARFGAATLREASVVVHVSPAQAGALSQRLSNDLARASLPQVTAIRVDAAEDFRELLESLQLVLGFIAAVALLTGALGVLNLGLITAGQRAREFAIRRSFGASSSDVFGIVMTETVVLSLLGGAVGVVAGFILVTIGMPLVGGSVGLTELPPYPLSAALLGLAIASLVGATAGIAPARLASRASIIETIRS